MERQVPKLVITGADGASREIDLTTRDLRIGRAPENDLSLPDPNKGVSRTHAELRYENGRYVIIDLNSQNGTWLDGTRVQRADLASGSEIAIGSYRLVLVGTGSPESKKPEDPNAIAARTIKVDAPAKPAPPPAPARSAPLPKRPAMRPVPPARAAGPIAALTSLPRPVLLGGCFAILLVIIVLGRLFATFESAPSTTTMADMTTAVPPPAAEPNAQIIERHLTEARTLTEKEDYETAIREHLDPILMIDPNHAEAANLKMRAQEALRAAQTASDRAALTVSTADVPTVTAPPAAATSASAGGGSPTKVPPSGGSTANARVSPRSGSPAQAAPAQGRGTPSTTTPRATTGSPVVETLPSPRRPNETPQQWRTRNADLAAQYNTAKGALERRNFATAISGFELLVKAEPDYLDAPQLLAHAREELKAGGKEAFDAGMKAEAAGNWTVAIENYERAQKIDPSLGAEEAARRVSEKMHAAAVDAFKRARQFDAVGRMADALKEYTNAAQWLPDTDANKAVARQRADQLRAGQR